MRRNAPITNGLWPSYDGQWWCSTATFGSLAFLLHKETGEEKYLRVATGALNWMIWQDFREVKPITFQQRPSGVIFYCFELYATGLGQLRPGSPQYDAAMGQIDLALAWMAKNQKSRGANVPDYLQRNVDMAGLPYLMYIFAHHLPQHREVAVSADQELRYIGDLLLSCGEPNVSRLAVWEVMTWGMMSYAERLRPRALYRCSKLMGADPQPAGYMVRLSITSDLPFPKVPMDPMIDFASLIKQAGLKGVLDPNSVQVVDVETDEAVDHTLSEHFAYGDAGRVQWVIEDPAHKEYEVRFRTAARRPPLLPRKHTPMIGTGDLLRYNADAPRPFPPISGLSRLIDLTGDGKRDLVGCGAYAYAPGWPFSGIFCYPRTGEKKNFEFGDLVRVRYLEKPGSTDFNHFTPGYMHADVADLNGDGLADVVFTAMLKSSQKGGRFKDVHKYIHLYLNSGKRDAGGMPVFVLTERLEHPEDWWGPVRAVDLNNDGAVDFVVGSMFRGQAIDPDRAGYYIKNTNPNGWPIRPAKPAKLDLLKRPCFYDVDGDGALDCVGLVCDPEGASKRWEDRVAWRKNLGGDPPKFGPPKMLDDINVHACTFTAAVNEGPRRGLLVSHNYALSTSFFEQMPDPAGKPRFARRPLVSDSAVIAGESNGCYPCDWDADGDWDILYGSCYGWVRILINSGSSENPVFDGPRLVFADGKPIHFQMTKIYPDLKRYNHDLGYPLPVFIDWDADGLNDLMLPNLSNRIFWCKNIGTRRQPKFGPLQQVICDGYPETKETLKAAAAALSSGAKSPHDPTQPFWWRARAAFGDVTGDGLADMITADATRTTTLFVQYRDGQGRRRLRKADPIKLPSGETLNRFIPPQYFLVDWDGDGLLDLIYKHGPVYKTDPAVARNIGTKTKPKFDTPVKLFCYGQPTDDPIGHIYYGIRDLDGDGKADFLISTERGTYAFYRHTAIQMKERPEYKIGKPSIYLRSERTVASVAAAQGELSTNRRNGQIVVTGDHFRIAVDPDRGGEIAEIELFDGSTWNRVLGGDGQTCPLVRIASKEAEYLLSRTSGASVEQYAATPSLVRFRTTAKPRTPDGQPGPWTVKLTYEIYAEGAVFIDLDYELTEGKVTLSGSSLSLVVDRAVTQSAKYCSEDTTLKVPPDAKRYDRPGFPSARVAFGKNPARSYTNEVEALVEYREPMGGGTVFREEDRRFSWSLVDRSTKLQAPYHYHNRFSIGLGATAIGKPKTNIIGQRVYHWLNRRKNDSSPGPDWYPSDELIDKMAANHATMLILHQDWMLRGGSCGDPHADYTRAGDHDEMVRTFARAHSHGIRVGLYMRGSEPYGLDASFFEKYCKRDWDGIYVDWHGAPSVAAHESRSKPDKTFEQTHRSADGRYQAAREYFLFTKRLRQIVGPKGFLIGHQGPWNSGVLANLGFDAYLPGEHAGDLNMFTNLDTTVYKGMMGGGACVLWPQSPPLYSREAVAKMAVGGLYPHVLLAYEVGPPLAMRDVRFEADPDAPVNSYALPYWRLLAVIDVDRATVFNLPSQNLVAATCAAADFHCLVYKESSDSYLIVVGNLGAKPAQTQITLVPEVLGMEGEYQVSRIDPQTGALLPYGATANSVTSTVLSQWAIEGFKLQRKATVYPAKTRLKTNFEYTR